MDPDLVGLGERVRLAGLAIGIFDSTRTSLHAVGAADLDWRFEIGSVTKLFTARLLELVAEEGAVDIEEPVTALLARSGSSVDT